MNQRGIFPAYPTLTAEYQWVTNCFLHWILHWKLHWILHWTAGDGWCIPWPDDIRDFVTCAGIFVRRPLTEISRPLTVVRRLFTEISRPLTEISKPFTEVSKSFTEVSKPFAKVLVEDSSSVGFSAGFSVGNLPITCWYSAVSVGNATFFIPLNRSSHEFAVNC